MPRSRAGTPPNYRHYNARNLAKVTIARRDIYLGPYNSRQSHRRYAQVIAAWQDGRTADEIEAIINGKPSSDVESDTEASTLITVGQLANRYWAEHAAAYYTSSTGLSRGRTANVRLAIREVNDLFAALSASGFGPLNFQQVRQTLVDRKRARRYINDLMQNVIAIFAWGVAQQLLAPSTPATLREVRPLRAGKTEARETDPVRPVVQPDVARTLPELSAVVRNIVQYSFIPVALV